MSDDEQMDACPADVEQLEDRLSEPSPAAIEAMRRLSGDLMLLGVGGKMGPTLARMARRASREAGVERRVIGVSRFRDPQARQSLADAGIETLACDLLDEAQVASLPEVENVLFMAGFKFGSHGNPGQTWATNCYLPAVVAGHFRSSRMAAFSSGNIYGLSPHAAGGSSETDPLQPVGEYAMTTLGRERILQYCSERFGMPLALLRLNYACELRYGVLVDLAQQIKAGEPVDVSMGYVNVIWQGDANAYSLCALAEARQPPLVINIAGRGVLRIRDLAEQLAERMGCRLQLSGEEAEDALLSDPALCYQQFGPPQLPIPRLLDWIADWILRDQPTLGKPTHFASRDGVF